MMRHLHADQHATIVCAVIAIVEQADVPAVVHAVEEIHQRAGTFREFEAEHDFILEAGRMSAYQVADVQLGHFVVGEILRF